MALVKNAILSSMLVGFFVLASAPSARALEVGDKAPDVELDSTKGGKLKLTSLKGKTVLIQFYVNDSDPTWIKELQSSSDIYTKFQAENTEVLGIAVSNMFAQKAFADFFKISYPLLTGGTNVTLTHKVMKDYGVLRPERLNAIRSYFIVDKEGILRYKNIRPTQGEQDFVPPEELLKEVKKINQSMWARTSTFASNRLIISSCRILLNF